MDHAIKLRGHTEQEITEKVYRRVGEVVKPTKKERKMSKERELLARVLTSELWSVQEELQAEIKELLDQPEPDLKRKPLSDEVICEILLKKEWKGFVELIRKIEELHGIGVEP